MDAFLDWSGSKRLIADSLTSRILPCLNGSRLELFDYRGTNGGAPRAENEVGLRHISFQVADVAAHEQMLREAGVEITLPTCDLPNLGVRVLLFLDPNGVTIEFCEPL